ncbi:hypothetical protein K443DRAFT_638667 [Laccaria amethystina LaAM-08-1]|uniref:Uncharacterized protein n=1 Tax=Laccaria amethystina LaAM-08-1 TaxID=1095629 RepID=A0A0C9XL84_9AGAR|nr:hypothetical protein K443DRAFT_638667 [Laccaria amethystina LaAM-08-1]
MDCEWHLILMHLYSKPNVAQPHRPQREHNTLTPSSCHIQPLNFLFVLVPQLRINTWILPLSP